MAGTFICSMWSHRAVLLFSSRAHSNHLRAPTLLINSCVLVSAGSSRPYLHTATNGMCKIAASRCSVAKQLAGQRQLLTLVLAAAAATTVCLPSASAITPLSPWQVSESFESQPAPQSSPISILRLATCCNDRNGLFRQYRMASPQTMAAKPTAWTPAVRHLVHWQVQIALPCNCSLDGAYARQWMRMRVGAHIYDETESKHNRIPFCSGSCGYGQMSKEKWPYW